MNGRWLSWRAVSRSAYRREATSQRPARRQAIRSLLILLPCSVLLCACRKQASVRCDDLRGRSEGDQMARALQQYTDRAPSSERRCQVCDFWLPARDPERCGRCRVLPGPVHPMGHCAAFVAKP